MQDWKRDFLNTAWAEYVRWRSGRYHYSYYPTRRHYTVDNLKSHLRCRKGWRV
jgi:hypothetical protein